MKTVTISAVTSGGRAFDVDFPLHEQTRSEQGVADLVTGLLEAISRTIESSRGMSDGDVIQSLAMTLAIRLRMLDTPPEVSRRLVHELLDSALNAARSARAYAAGRA
jgi:hypothetical protein